MPFIPHSRFLIPHFLILSVEADLRRTPTIPAPPVPLAAARACLRRGRAALLPAATRQTALAPGARFGGRRRLERASRFSPRASRRVLPTGHRGSRRAN